MYTSTIKRYIRFEIAMSICPSVRMNAETSKTIEKNEKIPF